MVVIGTISANVISPSRQLWFLLLVVTWSRKKLREKSTKKKAVFCILPNIYHFQCSSFSPRVHIPLWGHLLPASGSFSSTSWSADLLRMNSHQFLYLKMSRFPPSFSFFFLMCGSKIHITQNLLFHPLLKVKFSNMRNIQHCCTTITAIHLWTFWSSRSLHPFFF